MVTKAVAIDFWGFGSYMNWLGLTPGGDTLDAKIYTACASWTWSWGPEAVFDDASPSPPPTTFVTGAGLGAANTNLNTMFTGSSKTYNSESFYEWKWEDSCDKKRLKFA